MPSKASAKALGRLLKVPPKPDGNRLPVHKAAIAACGVLAQPDSLKDLEKLLDHKDVEIATAAGEALGGFKSIDKKKLDALIGRLVKSLAAAEKKVAKLNGKEGAAEAEKVQSAINGALAKLTGQTLATSKDWTDWIKESKKSKE
jgi:HEAT repeat protein